MNKIGRVDAVLKGTVADRPPFSMWYHFGNQHTAGEKFAAIVLEWFAHYDFDFLKLMNDYHYPMPSGLEELKAVDDLRKLHRFEPDSCDWKEQLTAVRVISAALRGTAYFVDTVFDPWQSLQNLAGEHLPRLAQTAPQELKAALDVVADNLSAYCLRSLALGSSGIFVSLLGGANQVSRDVFLQFVKPSAMKVFRAIEGQGRMNVVHVHGHRLYTDDVLDIPVPVISWEDRAEGNPSLSEMKERWRGVVMGGIDNEHVTRVSVASCRENVRQGLRQGGSTRFILANGCSIPSSIDPYALSAMAATARAAGATGS